MMRIGEGCLELLGKKSASVERIAKFVKKLLPHLLLCPQNHFLEERAEFRHLLLG
jgi:hypothetical protein